MDRRILYIVHDGQLYGSQNSLLLILRSIATSSGSKTIAGADLDGVNLLPMVSMARFGPLKEAVESIDLQNANHPIEILKHERLQWIKHDHRNWFQKIGDMLSLLFTAPSRVSKLAQLIKEHQIDLVHTNSIASLEGALAARVAGVPHCWHIRELFMEKSPKVQPVLGRALTRFLVTALSDKVLCISNAVRDQFGTVIQTHSEKFQLLYNAVDIPEVLVPIPVKCQSSEVTLGYVGRLSAGKRFDDVLEALAKLKKGVSTKQYRLLVAGEFVDTPYQERVQQKLKMLDLADAVTFLGYQPDLNSVFQQMDCLIVPSQNEPFGRVVIEAMLAGLPCIGTRAGGIPEILEPVERPSPVAVRYGWLYPPGDIDVLAEKLIELTALPSEELAQVQAQARQRVIETFSVTQQLAALRLCYKDVLTRSG